MLRKLFTAMLLSTSLQKAMVTPANELEQEIANLQISLINIEENPIMLDLSIQLQKKKNAAFFSDRWPKIVLQGQSRQGVKRKELHP